jgi:hypothetical protein
MIRFGSSSGSAPENRCEFCHLPQHGHDEHFSIDHIIARKHGGGGDDEENLALCCLRCNLCKGTNLSGLDPLDGSVVTLFSPRRDVGGDHFRWNGTTLVGSTPAGRATVEVLVMNAPERVRLRRALLEEGLLQLD